MYIFLLSSFYCFTFDCSSCKNLSKNELYNIYYKKGNINVEI